jgi:hypothetical protein
MEKEKTIAGFFKELFEVIWVFGSILTIGAGTFGPHALFLVGLAGFIGWGIGMESETKKKSLT